MLRVAISRYSFSSVNCCTVRYWLAAAVTSRVALDSAKLTATSDAARHRIDSSKAQNKRD